MYLSTLTDEVMAHHFYPLEEEVSFDQQSKRDVLPTSHPIRDNSQQERDTPCVSPAPEADGKNRNSTRRRIQVACNRCRKRKIKCSGDIGDGQGCLNCRSSGNTNNCQFLRVNSSMLQTKVSGWPYPTVNSTIPTSQRMNMYAAPPVTPKIGGVLPTNSPGLRTASFSRQSYNMGPTESQSSYTRPSLVEPPISYEDESAYTPPPSSYMIPNASHGAFAEYCALPWTKAWNPNMNMGRSTSGAVFLDHEAEGTVHQSAYPYMFSGQGTSSTDPSMALSETQGTDRTLPTPTTRTSQMGLSGFSTMPEAHSGLAPPQDFRIGQSWAIKTGASSNFRAMQTEFNGSSPINRTKSLPSSAQDVVFGLMPMTSTGATSPLMPSCGEFSGLESVESTGEVFREPQTSRSLSRNSINRRLMCVNEYGPEIYGYSSSEKRRCSEGCDSASTLINGLTYTRPKPPGPPPPALPLVTATDPYHTTESLRESAAPLSNPGGF